MSDDVCVSSGENRSAANAGISSLILARGINREGRNGDTHGLMLRLRALPFCRGCTTDGEGELDPDECHDKTRE